MIDWIAQAWITLFGASAIFIVGSRNARVRRWGYVCGLCAQPAWYTTMYLNEQWGLMPVFLIYTMSWIRGFWNHWLRKD